MRKWYFPLMVVALAVGIGLLPAQAQTGIGLSSSGSNALSFASTGSGGLNTSLGLSGAASGTAAGKTASSYIIATSIPISLSGKGSGTFSAGATALLGSALKLANSSSTIFTGTFTSLSLAQGANRQVGSQATANGRAASTASITGTIQHSFLTPRLRLPSRGAGTSGTSVSGSVVPEPASLLLFGSGLIGLGGVMRKRIVVGN